ncbi:protein-S-isoprenylcysteine O-methyltransferase, partial [Phenoliferia sp. Uapishka_3]
MSIDTSLPKSAEVPKDSPKGLAASVDARPPPPKGQFMPVEYPLTSFASTPHNVACIAFLLGGLWSLGLASASGIFVGKHIIWSPTADATSLPPQTLTNAIFSPFLGFYLASWAIFHLLEFVVTSMYNPGKLTVSSYLLDNGVGYHIAHAAGMLEHILAEAYFPAEWRKYRHLGGVVFIGLGLIIVGQILRSYAMISASSNFSHQLAFRKLASHELVKTGIYSWSRHPSYAGFTWWAVGTQIFLGNVVGTVVFSAVLYWFFSTRIPVEERQLIKFFGDDYIKYRQEVPTRILFIS